MVFTQQMVSLDARGQYASLIEQNQEQILAVLSNDLNEKTKGFLRLLQITSTNEDQKYLSAIINNSSKRAGYRKIDLVACML